MLPGSDLLFRHLRDRAHDLARHSAELAPPAPFCHADEYLLSSIFQKAIRRSNLTFARRAGHQLLALDSQRLWRRMAVVALEDIGIADMAVAAELVAIASLASARRMLGSDPLALDVALARACKSVKDRTGDHFGSIYGRERLSEADHADLNAASPQRLLQIVAAPDQPWTLRLRAAVIAAGRMERPPYMKGDIGAVFAVFRELGVPELLIASCGVYAGRQRDALPVFIPLAWTFRATGCTARVIKHRLAAPVMIGELPDWAFDPMNTRLGRQAVELFLRSQPMKPPYPPRMVAAALWNAESALCDRTLSWRLADEICERAYRADLTCRGLPVKQHGKINAWIARERPALTAARQAVWGSAIRELERPAEVLEQANLPLPVPEKPRRG